MMIKSFFFLASLFLTIPGRDGQNLYRIKNEQEWPHHINTDRQMRQDTRNALVEFEVPHPTGAVMVKIHNFPSRFIEERIPPQAQIARWRKDPHTVIPQSFSGFCGFLYQDNQTLAWTLQLGQEQYHALSHPDFPIEMRADVTIKAVGPNGALTELRPQIIALARSLELIEEIPQ